MENNQILEAARRNRSRGCEYENKESIRSNLLGSIVAIPVGAILFLIEYFVNGNVNCSLIAVAITAACVQSLYEGIKNKKIHLIVIGCIETLLVVISLLAFIAQVVAQ